MSSEQHNNILITPDNYEEFFLLYVDGELEPAAMDKVDAFVEQHPEFRAELDLLLQTRLEPETFVFDKSQLLSENIQIPLKEEELLLYLDNELDEDRKRVVELELAANDSYAREFDYFSRARLDENEIVSYPDKTELYRHERKIFALRPWMRVAAVAMLIGGLGYLAIRGGRIGTETGTATGIASRSGERSVESGERRAGEDADVARRPRNFGEAKAGGPRANEVMTKADNKSNKGEGLSEGKEDQNLVERKRSSEEHVVPENGMKDRKEESIAKREKNNKENSIHSENNINFHLNNSSDMVASLNTQDVNEQMKTRSRTLGIDATIAEDQNKSLTELGSLNKIDVTNNSSVAYNNQEGGYETPGNERKGSVRGFLRKATRMIEKTTGIDPTSNGELVIGVVAVNLK